MSSPRYRAYKDSGVDWLGDVPAHWQVSAFRRSLASPLANGIFKKNEDFGSGILLINVFDIYRDDHRVAYSDLERISCTRDEQRAYEVIAGDVFFVRSSLKEEGIAAVSVAEAVPEPVVFECHLIRARTDQSLLGGRFCSYLFNSAQYRAQMIRRAKITTMTTIDQEAILSFPVVRPPVGEQGIIVAFLDRETAKIDALVAEQQRLIELLKEKRQAVISHAVTKGLNPAAPMKDSGIEWLGKVPRHWELTTFRRVARIEEGQVSPTDERFSDWILVAPNHIESGTGRLLQLETAGEQAAISGKYRVRAGEVIYSKIRPALNKVCISDIDCLCSADMYPIRVSNGLLAPYLLYLMLSQPFVKLMVDESMRVAMPKINRDTLNACRIAIPPLGEQKTLVLHIHSPVDKFDALMSEAESAIRLLQERRTALISAAVTGKIDVRGLVTPHPAKEAAA